MKNVIVIPTYNEATNVSRIIETVFDVVPSVHILIVDDNSPDGTGNIVKGLQTRFSNLSLLHREKKEGLGRAYLNAFQVLLKDSDVEHIVTMDADFSHDPACLPAMLAASEYFDVVLGSRYVHGGGVTGWVLWRRLLSRWANFYARTITGLPLRDCTAGFICVRTNILRETDLSKIDASGYAFLIELKYLLWKSGARFKELPMVLRDRITGESKISGHFIREGVIAPWKMILRK